MSFVLVSGPSGVGKGPIIEHTQELYPNSFFEVSVHKTGTARHVGGEEELGFDGLSSRLYEFSCRGSPQAVDLDELDRALEEKKNIVLEIYYQAIEELEEMYNCKTVFISPLSKQEIDDVDVDSYLPDLMLDTLVRRAQSQGQAITRELVRELKKRAEDSVDEIGFSKHYGIFIPNHCYEGDPRWNLEPLHSEPKQAVDRFFSVFSAGYKICFANSYPGEPGSGSLDSDFYQGYDHRGTLEEAMSRAEQISRETYQGDFLWWIEDEEGNLYKRRDRN